VGILKQEHAGDVLTLIASDPRMPHMMVNAASMPFELRQQLQVLPTSDITADFWLNATHVCWWAFSGAGCIFSHNPCALCTVGNAAGKLQRAIATSARRCLEVSLLPFMSIWS